jgi:choline monooxygenase
MLNVYPWGISVNVVRPLGPERTRVSFLSYVLDPSRRQEGAGKELHLVEMEDEEVVESTQAGVRSRLLRPGPLLAAEGGGHPPLPPPAGGGDEPGRLMPVA